MVTRNLNDAEANLRIRFKQARRLFKKTFFGKRFNIQVSCVLRSNEEQMNLYNSTRNNYAQKAKKFGHKTYGDGVIDKSRHQPNEHGLSEAVDFFAVNKKTRKANWRCVPVYWLFGKFCERYGLEWGGRWIGLRDMCHVQLPGIPVKSKK